MFWHFGSVGFVVYVGALWRMRGADPTHSKETELDLHVLLLSMTVCVQRMDGVFTCQIPHRSSEFQNVFSPKERELLLSPLPKKV